MSVYLGVRKLSALGDLLGSVLERGVRLVDGSGGVADHGALVQLCADLMSTRGEASGVALASDILARAGHLAPEDQLAFFTHLAEAYDPDPEGVARAAEAYAEDQTSEAVTRLLAAAEPPRQELLRRLNMAPGGTAALVDMRARLLELLPENPALARIDQDFQHLLRSWFNRGFLVLRPIDWTTPAAVLEKIIAYEAVHQIDSWDELRRRVEPPDRRCFAYFHPSIPDEPLIFVEVALTKEIPGSIQGVLAPDRDPVLADQASVAVFYSISNCQAGLAGVSFGAFLIKQVARDLQAMLPGLKTFVTLSPVPGFTRWVEREEVADEDIAAAISLAKAGRPDVLESEDFEAAKPRVLALAARYFLEEKRRDGQPIDPVARFHLGNGAELAAIHWKGDVSERGLRQAAGLMVNYLYRLDKIEANHEAYAARRHVEAARGVKSLLKG